MTTPELPDHLFDPRHLTREEYKRYGRQMILPGWGLPGQLALKAARVAVVGAGGLGCPVLQYLAGAGVGTIDVHDHDEVSVSNLHRQVLHTDQGAREGWGKAESAAKALRAINPHNSPILPHTALTQLANAQIIVDCTDRPLTRYLLSDASVRLGVPLVSGAAISNLGQWAVYGGLHPTSRPDASSSPAGPSTATSSKPIARSASGSDKRARACYRCIWPKPLPGSSGRCEDVGVWGMVTGMVGTGMATEVVKLIIGKADPQPMLQTLHLSSSPMIRSTRLRPARPDCPSCGPSPSIGVSVNAETGESVADLSTVDYVAFCAGAGGDGDDWADYVPDERELGRAGGGDGADGSRSDKMTRSGLRQGGERMGVRELKRLLEGDEIGNQEGSRGVGPGGSLRSGQAGGESSAASTPGRDGGETRTKTRVRLVDTRSETEFGICSIPGSINIPLANVLKDPISALTLNPTPVPSSDPSQHSAPPTARTLSILSLSSDTPLPRTDTTPTTPGAVSGIDTIFICKLGNDSQVAVEAVRTALAALPAAETGVDSGRGTTAMEDAGEYAGGDAMQVGRGRVVDVRGGLRAWGRDVDPEFPLYF